MEEELKVESVHMIGVCCAEAAQEVSPGFNEIAERARLEFAGRTLVATTPPPERDVRIVLRIDRGLENLMSISLDRCFGLAFAFEALTKDGALLVNALSTLNGLTARLLSHNKRLVHYGVKVSVYAPRAYEGCSELYGFLDSWRQAAEATHRIPVSIDIARDEAQFAHILEIEHLRMVHGDIKAQFAALSGQ
jgi:hypothetical protein